MSPATAAPTGTETHDTVVGRYGSSMTDDLSLADHAREVRSQLGAFWSRLNNAVDDAALTGEEKSAVQRELAELARLPWDIVESLGGAPDEKLSDAAVSARAMMLEYHGLDDDVRPSARARVANAVATRP